MIRYSHAIGYNLIRMKSRIMNAVKDKVYCHLNTFQMAALMDVLDSCLTELFPEAQSSIRQDYVQIFLAAKRV